MSLFSFEMEVVTVLNSYLIRIVSVRTLNMHIESQITGDSPKVEKLSHLEF